MKRDFKGYVICDDMQMITPTAVRKLLSESYWAADRPIEVIEKSMAHSICFGVLKDDVLVGFARVVTDYATVFWLADVIVTQDARGIGLGKELIRAIMEDSRIKGLKGILATNDAHTLYEKYGFAKAPDKLMWKQHV